MYGYNHNQTNKQIIKESTRITKKKQKYQKKKNRKNSSQFEYEYIPIILSYLFCCYFVCRAISIFYTKQKKILKWLKCRFRNWKLNNLIELGVNYLY